MLPAQLRNRDTALSLADHTHDLGVSKAITLHQNLLNSYAEKILIQKSLFLWGDYHRPESAPGQSGTFQNPQSGKGFELITKPAQSSKPRFNIKETRLPHDPYPQATHGK
ncbi:hypothetical protein APA386B_2P3 (plasmid) [Acetobacter pasteurianus 386B]|nr:hypothetical protein APA386B_2P3 [Acetobacter pasteurianus 386B]